MLQGNGITLTIGTVIAAVLLAIGIGLGLQLARRRRQPQDEPLLDQSERERMLQLLQELGAWTSEYSGDVSEYQVKLGELSESVRVNPGQSENRVVVLLQQIMQSNSKLQTRLDAAERQLEKQTQQIECYLTEARTDGLTGLFNRRAFDQRMEELFIAYRRGGRSFVVALVDIDKFKSINDTYGHQAGDQILQQLSRTMRTQLEQSIIVARFGGEEFAAIMDGPLTVAANSMNEFRKLLAQERMDAGDLKIQVTISVGVSEARNDSDINSIVRRADESLYAAKNFGRNRVYYHDGSGPRLLGAPDLAKD
jgi:diguanylate cyclase